jgi:glutamate 5-kinase
VERIVSGESIGTTFLPTGTSLSARKKWLAFSCQVEGRILVNDGARQVIVDGGKSLLPVGIVQVVDSFDQGACVDICTSDGTQFAKGLVNYSSFELNKIKGRPTKEIRSVLNFKIADEAVHRDDMVLMS